MSPASDASVTVLDSSIVSLKDQESYGNMRKTLKKMHKSMDYVYEEMPRQEAEFLVKSKGSRDTSDKVYSA